MTFFFDQNSIQNHHPSHHTSTRSAFRSNKNDINGGSRVGVQSRDHGGADHRRLRGCVFWFQFALVLPSTKTRAAQGEETARGETKETTVAETRVTRGGGVSE